MNFDILIEMATLALSVIAFAYSYSTTRENYFQKVRTLEQREYFNKQLEKETDEMTRDINNIGGRINAIQTRLALLEYQLIELKNELDILKKK